MGTEFKGRAWFGKIYNKLETILVEVDTFTSQNTLCLNSSEWESVRSESEDFAEEPCDLQLPSCESPSDPPLVQSFEDSGYIRVEGERLKESVSVSSLLPDGEVLADTLLLQDYCDGNMTSTTTLGGQGYCNGNITSATTIGDEEQVITDEQSMITDEVSKIATPRNVSAGDHAVVPGEEGVEEDKAESLRDDVSIESQSTQCSVESFEAVVDLESMQNSTDDSNLNSVVTKILDVHVQDDVANTRSSNDGNVDDVVNEDSDVSPLDTISLHDKEVPEEPSFVDDNELYAVRVRTKKLRSFQRKVLDALASKRIREKDYEQLSIWFGDADMGSDLPRSSQVHEQEDSHWELL